MTKDPSTHQRQKTNTTPGQLAITTLMIVALPLIGIFLGGKDLRTYLEFPPETSHVVHAPFSWRVFTIYAVIDILLFFFLTNRLLRAYTNLRIKVSHTADNFPAWGWAGLLILAGGWFLAWTRFEWFALLQGHTFCLPWIGYIILVNALCIQRSGCSLMTDSPVRFAGLIVTSTIFWWFFEYLNRFVQNWYYVGVDDFGPTAYTLFASLAFATVLPAVLSTYRLLLTLPVFDQGLTNLPPLHCPAPRLIATIALLFAAVALALLGNFPDMLFAMLWVSPLLVITALQTLGRQPTIFTTLGRGDWRPLVAAAIAALVCGFFWELWNIGSQAQWRYAIAYVDRFHLFAMPILGYGGYLPFGLECLVVGSIVVERESLCL